jgi:death-on-curing protein
MSELDFRFLTTNQIIAIHDYALQHDGGRPGIRDRNALESLVLAPQKRAAYESVDAFDLAAVYAHSANRNPAFVDGNKRTALTVALVFLGLNGYHDHNFRHDDLEKGVFYLANSQITREMFAEYLRDGFDGVPGTWIDDPEGQPDRVNV